MKELNTWSLQTNVCGYATPMSHIIHKKWTKRFKILWGTRSRPIWKKNVSARSYGYCEKIRNYQIATSSFLLDCDLHNKISSIELEYYP